MILDAEYTHKMCRIFNSIDYMYSSHRDIDFTLSDILPEMIWRHIQLLHINLTE